LSIGYVDFDEVVDYLVKADLAEIRVDLLDFSEAQLKTIFGKHNNLIATYRAEKNNYEKMLSMLMLAMNSGCAYVDIDIDVPENWRTKVISKAKKLNKKVIISYHNYIETPGRDYLNNKIEQMFGFGADIVKIACIAINNSDCSRIISLYKNTISLVAFSMGEKGVITRFAAPTLGAPFTYVSIPGKETAPGQVDYETMKKFLNKYLPL